MSGAGEGRAALSDDAHLIERRTGGQTLISGGFLEVRRDDIALPDGGHATREYVVHPGAVGVVAILDDGRIVMERQYRYPIAQVLLEIPAGKIDAGEPPFNCAVRELREETGYSAREWARACLIHNAPAYATEIIEIWFARGLVAGAQKLDAGEFLELHLMTEAELDALAARGELTDVKTLIALMWLQKWRAGLWPLDWQSAP
jgi:ADP-ribose pyrophosphatase